MKVERVHTRADRDTGRWTVMFASAAIVRAFTLEQVDCIGELVVEIADGW